MEDIEKVLRNLDEKNEDDFLNSDKGKAVLSSIALVKHITREVAAKSTLNCEHDIEEICAFFEGNVEDNEKTRMEEQIFSCDSCFSVYTQLQSRLEEVKNHAPEWLKEQVIDKEAKADQAEKKGIFASLFYIFKNNIGLMASGLTVATIILIYIGGSPNEESSKMEVAKAPEKQVDNMKSKETENKIARADKVEKKEAGAINLPKPATQDLKEPSKDNSSGLEITSGKNAKVNSEIITGIISTKSNDLKEQNRPDKLSVPAEKKLDESFFKKEIKNEIFPKTSIAAKRPVIVNPVTSKPKSESALSAGYVPSAQPKTDEPVMIADVPGSEAKSKQKVKEEEQVQNNTPESTDKIARDGEKNVEVDNKDLGKMSQAEPAKAIPNVNSKKPTTISAAPSMNYKDDKSTNKNVALADEDQTILKNENRVARAKGKVSPEYSVTINSIEFEKPGFIVIHKDIEGKRGEIIGNTKLFSPGKYFNIKVQINKESAGKKVQAVIYEDLDNNNLFDTSDKPFMKNNSPVIKIIEIN